MHNKDGRQYLDNGCSFPLWTHFLSWVVSVRCQAAIFTRKAIANCRVNSTPCLEEGVFKKKGIYSVNLALTLALYKLSWPWPLSIAHPHVPSIANKRSTMLCWWIQMQRWSCVVHFSSCGWINYNQLERFWTANPFAWSRHIQFRKVWLCVHMYEIMKGRQIQEDLMDTRSDIFVMLNFIKISCKRQRNVRI